MDIFDYNIPNFWKQVNKTENCWEWTGNLVHGYGKFWSHNKQFRAHRVSWEIHNGVIPDGKIVCHKCDNRKCINPKHLFIGTNQDNTDDMFSKGRQGGNKKISPEDVLVIRALYHWSNFEVSKIAKEFNLTRENISLIVKNKTWTNVRTSF